MGLLGHELAGGGCLPTTGLTTDAGWAQRWAHNLLAEQCFLRRKKVCSDMISRQSSTVTNPRVRTLQEVSELHDAGWRE